MMCLSLDTNCVAFKSLFTINSSHGPRSLACWFVLTSFEYTKSINTLWISYSNNLSGSWERWWWWCWCEAHSILFLPSFYQLLWCIAHTLLVNINIKGRMNEVEMKLIDRKPWLVLLKNAQHVIATVDCACKSSIWISIYKFWKTLFVVLTTDYSFVALLAFWMFALICMTNWADYHGAQLIK